MLTLLFHQALFLLALPFVLLLPGMALLRFAHPWLPKTDPLERLVLSIALSIVFVDTLFLIADRIHIPLTRLSIFLGIILFSAMFWLCAKKRHTNSPIAQSTDATEAGRALSPLFLILFVGMVFLKTIYLFPVTVPNATDLGHHMYWVKKIALEHQLPQYTERDIIADPDGSYGLSDPQPISDFIVGEHLVLAAVQMLSQMDYTSSFSILTLFFIHIMTAVGIYVLARRLFEKETGRETIALLAFLLIGTLYAFMPPQMKYIEGGVMGNNLSNFLIPSALLLVILAVRNQNRASLTLALLILFGMAYTHHLSTFLFAIAAVTAAIFFTILDFRQAKTFFSLRFLFALS